MNTLSSPAGISVEKYAFLICIAAALLSFFAVFSGMDGMAFMSAADEGHYLRYAEALSGKGVACFPDLFRDYLSNRDMWQFPNPLRIGYIILSALSLRFFGQGYLSLAYISLLSHFTFIIFSFLFVRKHFGSATALQFAVLAAFSPRAMGMARRALPESAHYLFLAASVWVFLDMLAAGRPAKYIPFVLLYTAAILIKESAIAACPVFLAAMIVYNAADGRADKRVLYPVPAVLLPILIALGVYAAVSGDPGRVFKMADIIIRSPGTNNYALLYGSGPWYRYIIDFMLLSPAVAILSAGFIFSYLAYGRRDAKILYFIAVYTAFLIAMNFFTRNARYVMLLDMPARLFAVLMLRELAQRRFPKYERLLVPAAVVFMAVYDYAGFRAVFIDGGVYDPVSCTLLFIRKMIPLK